MDDELKIIYRDRSVIVVIKPEGVLSEDSPGGMPELIRKALGDPEADVRSVHRLDRAVSGLMVYALNAEAASGLIRAIAEKRFDKQYLAVTEGIPEEPEGRMEDLLYHSARENKTYVVKRMRKGVRAAALLYRVLGTENGRALVLIRLLTGRTHQIRVQFGSRRLPLAGDRRYGAPEQSSGIALWSCHLGFTQPVTGKKMSFTEFPPLSGPWNELSRHLPEIRDFDE